MVQGVLEAYWDEPLSSFGMSGPARKLLGRTDQPIREDCSHACKGGIV